ncbi:MAG: RidA family protein [Pseudomonadota bacterium]|nr:RidA family protein [Pseudomonadota bacterium]
MKALNPPGWNRPRGYSNGIAAEGRLVFVAGMVGWNAEENFESDDFVDQFRLALENTVLVLNEGDAAPEHICRMTMYFTNKEEYLSCLPEIGSVYRDVIGRNFPTMAALQVVALMEDRAKVEIETTAVVPL